MGPQEIRETVMAFQKSRIILTAFQLDIFTFIGEGSHEAESISQALGLNKNATERLLNALVALELSFFSSNQEKYNAFKELTFEKFIQLLPQAYMKNRHLHPQVKKLKDLKNMHKLKLESEDDLQFMKNELGIDTGIRANQTDKKDFDLKWTREMIDVVNDLYREDFEFFGYPMR